MKKNILYFLLIVLIFINLYLIISNFVFSRKNSYLIFDSNNVLKIDNNSIKKVNKKIIKRLNYSEIYICQQECEKGYFNDGIYFEVYNNNLEKINLTSESFIKTGKKEIKNFYENSINNINSYDENLISKVLDENNLNYKITDLFITKIKIDSDINAYSLEPYLTDEPSNNNFSLVFISNKTEYEIIYMKKNSSRLSSLNKVIDINNDDLIEIILLSDMPGSAGNECYSLYQYNKSNNKYKPVINCEVE